MILFKFKILYINTITLFILCFSSIDIFGQIFDNEQNPPSLKWMQINTENFQIIYPLELSDEAQRMSNTLQHIIKSVGKSLNKTPNKISVILQNQSVLSNGFVQLGPRRSEFFTTPPQDLDFQDWLNSLAVHELRHVVQFDKLTGKLKAPFFEELALAFFGISLPPWFYEGDAVGVETALSSAGRGRLPNWELIFRTNTLSTRKYSYSKNYFGSLKDRTPGYYQLGYFMTSKLRRDYGNGILDSILTQIREKPFRPYNFNSSLKKLTGLSTTALHDSTLSELTTLWQKQAGKINPKPYPALNKRVQDLPADYLFPVKTERGEILALKQSLARTPEFILIDSLGKEKKLKKIGYQSEYNFRYAAGKIVWDEYRFDKRYQKRSFNVINIYDIAKSEYKQLTHKSRLFSPSLSEDGKQIVAVKVYPDNRFTLVELDAENGKVIREHRVPMGYSLQTPAYHTKGNRIICVAVTKEGASLLEFNLNDKSFSTIIPFQRQQITRPIYAGNSILFRAHYNGLDNIYCIEPGEQPTQATSALYGATNPSYDKTSNTILFNNYRVSGYDIAAIPYQDIPKNKIDHNNNSFIDYVAPLVVQEANAAILDSIPHKQHPVKTYNEFKNLFYFHSLSPLIDKNSNNDMGIGLKIKSDNLLNTLEFYSAYQYNSGLNRSEYLTGFTYKRFYPILTLTYQNRANLAHSKQNNLPVPVNWRENFMKFEMSVPFRFNRLNQSYNLGLRSSSSYTSRYNILNKPSTFIDKLKFPMNYQIYFSRNTQRSARDLAPRWGQNFSLSYFHLPFQNQINGSLLAFRSTFYTPGLFSNHSFQASFNYQENSGAYTFNIEIPRVSAYSHMPGPNKLRNTLLFDYRFPLFYPDVELGPVAYIKRLKGGFFADFENIGKTKQFSPRSYGLELSADMNLMRFYLPNFDLIGKFVVIPRPGRDKKVFETGISYSF